MGMREYRCTRNALYLHKCIGYNNLKARQGYYIWAISEEVAWQEMAKRYPDETQHGFTIQPWDGFNVQVVEAKRFNLDE